jgi:indolepyruvate ferredoxin oxidoreductase, beta subunit
MRDPPEKGAKEVMTGNKTINILFCGTGGQGVLSAAEICGWAALFDGYHVKKSEVHGMAQRGGSVESHLRFGTKVYSPLIPKGEADYLVSFHPDEQARLKSFLKPSGQDLLPFLNLSETQVEDKKFVNSFILGGLSKYLPIKEESWIKALELVFAGKKTDENIKIFKAGRKSQ